MYFLLNPLSGQDGVGQECWSSSGGVVPGGCPPGTQCGAWLPEGGDWDGSSPWYCLYNDRLPSGASCNYEAHIGKYYLYVAQ